MTIQRNLDFIAKTMACLKDPQHKSTLGRSRGKEVGMWGGG